MGSMPSSAGFFVVYEIVKEKLKKNGEQVMNIDFDDRFFCTAETAGFELRTIASVLKLIQLSTCGADEGTDVPRAVLHPSQVWTPLTYQLMLSVLHLLRRVRASFGEGRCCLKLVKKRALARATIDLKRGSHLLLSAATAGTPLR